MISIYPLPEESVTGETKVIFEEIKEILDIESVPVNFRYMANFPQFLNFAWGKIKKYITQVEFDNTSNQIIKLSEEMIKIIFNSSDELNSYVKSLSEKQETELRQTIEKLIRINSTLLIISIATRESLKGIVVLEQKQLSSGTLNSVSREIISKESSKAIAEYTFGLEVLYPEFYELISKDMTQLIKTERYLKSRVELERFTQLSIESLPEKLNFPFRETINLLRINNHSSEILYLINHSFPSNYPHQLFTSLAMKILTESSANVKLIRD